jgi:glucokinase
MGLENIDRFLRARSGSPDPAWLVEARERSDAAAAISTAAMSGDDAVAVEALEIMVRIYGAQAGNLALSLMALGGVFVGGGIAPKILSRLSDGAFMEAFAAKGRVSDLVQRIPVTVILNEHAALMGAARAASTL